MCLLKIIEKKCEDAAYEGRRRTEAINEIRYFVGHGFVRTVKFLESCPNRGLKERLFVNTDDDVIGEGFFDFKYWAFREDNEGMDWDIVFWENGIEISQQVIEKIKNTYNERYDKIKLTLLCCIKRENE